ncbi:MAG: hypothetical protein GY755_04215 [Chloroflexi bacterium]|nr:hypothetical protein [Chloroflexota bacterium]
MQKDFPLYRKRFIIVFLFSLIFVGIVNEGAHFLLKEKTDRPPETVEISIPAGTAKKVEAGQADPSIPSELTFVIGDTLLVTNKDDVPHELGPLWIPADSSASLLMENANKYTLGCTFQPSRYLNFDVRSRTTATSRFQAFALATPPTAMFFFLYSLLVYPLKGKEKKKEELDASTSP